MRALLPSVTMGLALAAGGCAFRPAGGSQGDDDDDDVTGDAAAPTPDAASAIDAADDPVPDARPGFDFETCPSSYVRVWNAPSRYRMIDPVPWASAAAICKAHSQGLTHLAVLGGQGERDAVGGALVVTGDFRRTWIGVWNNGTGARTVTGEPLYPSTGLEPGQAVSWIRDLVTPFRGESVGESHAALCECDGLPASP